MTHHSTLPGTENTAGAVHVRAAEAVQRIEAVSLRGPLPPASATMVSLAQGEPDFTSPKPVNEALVQAIEDGYSHYTHASGDPALRERIAQEVAVLSGQQVGRDQVLVTHGGTGGLAVAILGLINPGDRVVIPDPTYSLYADLIAMAGGQCVRVPLAADLHWDLDALAQALPGAAMFVFCNPGNPTGIVHSAQELQQLATLLEGTDTLVLADEAYSELVYEGRDFTSVLQVPQLRQRSIYSQTFSKKYAMTGWRLGYLAGPAEAIAAAARVHATVNGPINTAVQRAALAALDDSADDVAAMVASYTERRDLIMRELASVPQLECPTPEGAFYIFPSYSVDLPSTEVVAHLRQHGVSTRPGSEYGPAGEGRIRLSYAASAEDIVEGVRRLRLALESLG